MKSSNQSKGMVDISQKSVTKRVAIATATVKFPPKAFKALLKKGSPKGDVFETAKVAGIMAAKNTPTIIPMCHPLELSKVAVSFEVDKKKRSVTVQSEVSCLGRTGVEMEALTAVTIAALTIYDMMKWSDHGIAISDVRLLSKSGGKSGFYRF
ncbi:MAG TPA: cyclic pyranopterin monophosphate synthase MoaC [Candidatus Omnitrophota bacterium]|nr:cyclic pyranopterin monophosphate synthase MoaC [Candidatus Omnitrophota bacterium]HPD85587.1 cyclic pyranopterin monophosphate synthase MoaC [Candidatus Omnitrophota bacterium]HRZ04373.1 cyclic pyranopterin monophosphate synthase MoaC [Candidatus Omnitrophota bacterium]